MSTLKVNNIDAYSNNGAQGVRVRSSLIVGGVTGSGNQNQVYTGSNEDVYASLALGFGTDATGLNSVAFGSHGQASGMISFAQGSHGIADGDGAHVEGLYNHASGSFSHAEGHHVTASGNYSHASGYGVTANAIWQNVVGHFNAASYSNSDLFIIGGGTSDNNRKNIAVFNKVSGVSILTELKLSGALDISGSITPGEDNLYDLGSSTKQWRNLYIDGIAEVDTLNVDNVIGGTISGSRLRVQNSTTTGVDLASATPSKNGGKVTVQAITAAQINDGAFAQFNLLNTSLEEDSVIVCSFNGKTVGNITGSILRADVLKSATNTYTASVSIFNESGTAIAADTGFTASFVVL